MKSIRTPVASVAFLIFFLSSPASAQKPLQVSISPVRFEFAGYPGQVVGGVLTLANGMDQELAIVMEVEDFAPEGEEGEIAVGAGMAGERSLVSWVRFYESAVFVPPRSRASIKFSIDVPVDAEPGTHYGAVLAVAQTQYGQGSGPQIVTKVGAVVLVDVYGDVREQLSVASFEAPRMAWTLPIDLAVRFQNTGTVRARPHGEMVVTNIFGTEVARLPIEEANVLPGAVRRFPLSVREGLWAGRYTARIEATYGLTNPLSVAAETTFWFIDGKNVGLPLLILFGTLLFLLSRHRNIRPALRTLKQGDSGRP